jgi:hypothetical protein
MTLLTDVFLSTPPSVVLFSAAATELLAAASKDVGGTEERPGTRKPVGLEEEMGSRCSFVSGRRVCAALGSHFFHSLLR